MLAPIVLFTFRRLDLLSKTIESIKNCRLVNDSILHVYSDGGRNEVEMNEVQNVRNFLKSISGFKEIIIHERPCNWGVDYNLIEGLKEVAELYDQFIIIEDDLIFSANFLEFMNDALNFYKPFTNIISVNGFNYIKKFPIDYDFDTYLSKRSWSWGWGSWSNRIKNVDWEVKDFNEFITNKRLQNQFNKGGSDLTKMLIETMTGKIRTWDIRLFYHQFKYNLLSVYPIISKSTNIGFNQNATHTFGYNRYKGNIDNGDFRMYNFTNNLNLNKKINYQFVKVNNLYNRLKTRILSLIGIK